MKKHILYLFILIIMSLLYCGCKHEHEWKEATCDTPRTCSICGETTGTTLGHMWKDATCTQPQKCERCSATNGQANGHSWGKATCKSPKTCLICKKTEGTVLNHKWKNATCTAPKTCSLCGSTDGKALGHQWSDATCTMPSTCAICKKTAGNPKAHTYIGGFCSACGVESPNRADIVSTLEQIVRYPDYISSLISMIPIEADSVNYAMQLGNLKSSQFFDLLDDLRSVQDNCSEIFSACGNLNELNSLSEEAYACWDIQIIPVTRTKNGDRVTYSYSISASDPDCVNAVLKSAETITTKASHVIDMYKIMCDTYGVSYSLQ